MSQSNSSSFVPTCVACGKTIANLDDAIVCSGCMDATACSVECWSKVTEKHVATCCCDVGIELGTVVCDSDAVGSRHGGSGSRPTVHYSTGMHHSGRHPQISQSKLRTMLHHGSVRGHPLTPAQRGYFGHLLSRSGKM